MGEIAWKVVISLKEKAFFGKESRYSGKEGNRIIFIEYKI